jgi:tRNA (adenine57-N1/adenine58-N1)-methyltransferase
MPSNRALLQAGESVLFTDRKDREYLRTLKPGGRISLRGGELQADDIIGQPEGLRVRTPRNEAYWIFRPTYAHLIPNLPRRAQVIYPKDVGPLLLWGDIFPGASVLEVGVGPGAMTIALLRAIGPNGTLTTIEAREDFAEMARENVSRFFGEAPNWTLTQGNAYEQFEAPEIDRVVIDVPEPWRVIPHAARVLRPGGVFVGYSPTTVQVKTLVDDLRAHPCFTCIEVMENLLRFWHVEGLSVRPEHRMVAHTGFIMIARRTAEAVPDTPHASDVPAAPEIPTTPDVPETQEES